MHVLDYLNSLSIEYASLIQLLMMLSVSAATIISLWSTWRLRKDNQIQVEYECDISSIYTPTLVPGEDEPRHRKSHDSVTATLTNVGLRPTSVPWISFGLVIPFSKNNALLNPATDYRIDAPLPLNPGERLSLELRSPDQLREEIIGFNLKWFLRFRIRKLRLTFSPQGNEVFKARIGKSLRKHIKQTAAQTSWIYDRARSKGLENQTNE